MHTRTFALSLVASLLLIASALYAAPTGVTSAAPGLPTPEPVCIPVHSVALSGPAVGDVGIYLAYHVAASAMGFAPTLPITVEWTVSDLAPATQELEGGPEGSYEFRWELGGVKTIHVTAANACTTTPAEATLDVTINPLPVDEVPVETVTLTGPTTGVTDTYVGYQVAVSAVESPPTLPVTIDWAVTDLTPVRQEIESGSATSYEFRWDRGGVKTIHVTATNAHTTTPAEATLEVVIYPLPVDDAPADIYRRAARFLEEQRVSGQAPEWEDAVLASGAFRGSVMPMYRPDIPEAAYYEFTVFRPDGDLYQPAGFLILSAGGHDYPVTNWSVGGTPPSERLRQQASDAEEQAIRFLKLDALSYVAENTRGERIATQGDLPPRIILPDGWAENPPPITSVSWVPTTITDQDAADGTPAATPAPIVSGTLETPTAGTWGSWEEFKTSYASEYAPFLTRLAERAADEWTAERWAQEYGYTLLEGDSVSVPLFEGHTGITYEGPGLGLISTEVLTPAGAGAVLRVTAIDSVP
ncbi:MAG: hypothetical protein GX649_18225, partial [Chloroflexi bacterium]|nr:hypothetical protein [Chloroflexota bacterium]